MTTDPQDPRFHGRRRGKKLRNRAQGLINDLLPRLAIPEPGPDDRLDPFALFPNRPRAVWLEVGFGGGEHLAAQAAAHPDIGVIGCEVFLNGIARLLVHVDELALENVRLFPEDARRLLPALPEASLEKAFVMFPDPWPKTRHSARRFIHPETLDVLARLLIDSGELRVASDDPTYIDWMLTVLAAHPLFDGGVISAGPRPEGWPGTRYEAKAHREGRPPTWTSWRRVGR
ncbi:MAG: tRNA (guanosine(46)-N7)-methyltransferase TrmB [Alphaproteobacteria bacterium]|nr:tRNA (guanosine(46)-N7)-methyltransferase TrmB [Alphaproteobacteria bacterium]